VLQKTTTTLLCFAELQNKGGIIVNLSDLI
jgi:hypothetical protein